MAGFYKKDINQLFYAPNYVYGDGYSLVASQKDSYTFPIRGWYWFSNELDARQFFNMPPLSEPIIIPNYLKFWDDLVISSVYQSIRNRAINSLEIAVVCTEFVASISDAKLGKPNHDAIQACINLLVAASNFTESEVNELKSLMVANNLHYLYSLSSLVN